MSGDVPSLSFPGSHIAELRLRRPERANRIEPRDLATLQAHLDSIEARGDVRVVLLAADGRTFSAGFDLGALTDPDHRTASRGQQQGERREHGFEAFADRLASLPLVTVAMLQGPVVGGATDLALACDLRIGTSETTVMMPAARIGVPLYASALHRYVACFGLDRAKRLVLRGETISAADLLAWGFLSELTAPADLQDRVLHVAGDLADLPAAPIAAMKSVLTAAVLGDGPTAGQRALLDSAYDPAVITARVAAMKARRQRG
jgi:enoyl-CoA hydratase/carnithine racemase